LADHPSAISYLTSQKPLELALLHVATAQFQCIFITIPQFDIAPVAC